MGNLYKWGNFGPYLFNSIETNLYKRGSGEWGIENFQSYYRHTKLQAYFCPKMKNFAQVSVSKQNLDYNPKVMKKIILLFSQLYFPLCIFQI